MKKLLIPVLFIFCFYSCQKSEKGQISNYESTAALLEQDAKGTMYSFIFVTGHPASECNGCVTYKGRTFHIDCMGPGNECVGSSIVSLVQNDYNDYTATTVDSTALTNEDYYNMPARSLFTGYDEKNYEVWLNIPAQLVYRDSISRQFSFTGLYYSNSQIYANN